MVLMSEETKKPTLEEFLGLKPKRRDFLWSVDNQDVVHITVPKFQNSLGKKLCKILRRQDTFQADMDKIGSFVWKNCDGNTTVGVMLNALKEKFPDEQNIEQRFFHFLLQIRQLNYLDF